MQTSNYTGRANRSMEQAFGPGHRGGIYTKPEPMILADKIIVISFCVSLMVVSVASVFGVFK